jgi:hypothetical protein
VLAARVGYFDDGDAIGDVPCIAASVRPSQTASFEVTGSAMYNGVPVRYVPATLYTSASDAAARAAAGFSFAQVNEPMEATLHVGPEYSWEVLEDFLKNSRGSLVSAMYEFHAAQIKNAIEARLKAGGSLTLVMDNATFHCRLVRPRRRLQGLGGEVPVRSHSRAGGNTGADFRFVSHQSDRSR